MSQPIVIALNDFIRISSPKEFYEDELIIFGMNNHASRYGEQIDAPPIRLDAFTVFFAIQGKMSIDIDYISYHLFQNMLLQISSYHIMDKMSFSPDFKGYMVVISMDIFNLIKNEIVSLRSLGMESGLFRSVQELDEADSCSLQEVITAMRKNTYRKDHTFQKYLIKNSIADFLLELANINIKKNSDKNMNDVCPHKEAVILKFIKLLVEHCKEQHQVSFYAMELCMTPENLSRIIKDFSGKTANVWISGALLAEAKILLRNPEMSIQQVAEKLNFGDQSSFGKFFKKNTGDTPSTYKDKVFLTDRI